MLTGPFHLMDMMWINVQKHRRIFVEAVLWVVAISLLQWAVYYFGEAFVPNPLFRAFLSMLILLPLSLAAVAVSTAFITLSDDAIRGKTPSLKGAIGHGFHLLMPMIWVSFLVSISLLGGFMLLIIPGLLLIIYLAFSRYALAIDGLRGSAALKASWNAVSGRFWQVLARIVIPNVIYIAMVSIPIIASEILLGLAFGNLPLVFSSTSVNDLPLVQSFLVTVCVSFFGGFAIPLSTMTMTLLWKELSAAPYEPRTSDRSRNSRPTQNTI
jgi:hypothetical protein